MAAPIRWLWASMQAHPWRWTLAMFLPLLFIPRIDIGVSAWFFDPATGTFPARTQAFCEWVRRSMPAFLFAALGYVWVLWAYGEWTGRWLLGISRRVGLYLSLSLALGPGLVVNAILKEYWGRPRPSTIHEFGGPNYFVPPLVISDQCDSNCSFSSGHGALGFWPMAFALLAPPPWRIPAMVAALMFGAMVGLVRIAQGGHFLSDVYVSAVVTLSITFWLYKRLVLSESRAPSKNNRQNPDDSR